MSDKNLAVKLVLPKDIQVVEYRRNTHFIRFGRKGGQETKLVPNEMVLYFCKSCQFEMLTESNHGPLYCPVCRTGLLQPRWVKRQTCFIPEKESNFEWPQA